jgi:ribosomal protein S18 acetylase RimI-like enzyme
MKIKKANKKDIGKFIELRKKYIESINKENKIKEKPNIKKIKKEFGNFLKKNKIILVTELNNQIIGYIAGNIFENVWKRGGYIDDVYVYKEFRRKGIATQLIEGFLNELKKRKIKSCQLGVSKTNKKAIKLYKKAGFDLVHYEMGIKM